MKSLFCTFVDQFPVTHSESSLDKQPRIIRARKRCEFPLVKKNLLRRWFVFRTDVDSVRVDCTANIWPHTNSTLQHIQVLCFLGVEYKNIYVQVCDSNARLHTQIIICSANLSTTKGIWPADLSVLELGPLKNVGIVCIVSSLTRRVSSL